MNDAEILELPVAEISPGPLVRKFRVDQAHAELLIPALDSVPPILVRETGTGWSLIDGQHRLTAAKLDHRETVRGVVVALDDAEALEAAIKANTGHGKALTLEERRTAALTLVESTDWSDRRISDACGLHRSTVARIRPECSGGTNRPPEHPKGSDGKTYPSSPAVARLQRARAVAAYVADPTLSVRALAKLADVSVGVAQDVIANQAAEPGQGPVPDPAPVPDTSTDAPVPPGELVDGTGGPAAPGASSGRTPDHVSDEGDQRGEGPEPAPAPLVATPTGFDWDVVFAMSPENAVQLLTDSDDLAALDDAADWLHRFFAARKEMAA